MSCDGKNQKNIIARKKGTGIITQIMSILEDVCFGKYFFQVAIILRNSLLISSLLTNAEGWYNLTKSEIEELESVDERLLRKVLESPVSTPKEMLYLELGVLPIGFIIRMRRLNFLKYSLDEDENSLIHTFLKAQLEDPNPNDWGQSCLKDLEMLNLNLEVEEIKAMPKSTFRNIIKKQTNKKGLEYLNKKKNNPPKWSMYPTVAWKCRVILKLTMGVCKKQSFCFPSDAEC